MNSKTDFPQRVLSTDTLFPALPPLSRQRYTNVDFYQKEVKQVWRKSWLFAGHAAELPKPGDLLRVDIPIAPVFLARDKDGSIKAFINSCQHRGATLLTEECSHRQRIACPYHGWTYSLDGKLQGVSGKEGFPGLNKEELSLHNLRCEQLGEFVFINFDPDAPPLSESLGQLGDRMRPVVSSQLRKVHKQRYEIPCNWKIAAEAFRESYHADYVHRSTAGQGLESLGTNFDIYANGHGLMLIPLKEMMAGSEYKGIVTKSPLPMIEGIDHEDYTQFVLNFCQFPATIFAIQPKGILIFSILPDGVDDCVIDQFYFASDWGEGERPEEIDAVIAAVQLLAEEDLAILNTIQRSIAAEPDLKVNMSTHECLAYQIHVETDRMIGRENIAPEMQAGDCLQEWIAV